MAQWEEKLGAILNNPQAMSQIMSIAQSLDSGSAASDAPETPPSPEPQAPGTQSAPQSDAGPGLELDPRLMEMGMRALSAYQDPNNDRAALLQALRPFVKEARQSKLDKAIQITRLSKVVRVVLDGWKGGED